MNRLNFLNDLPKLSDPSRIRATSVLISTDNIKKAELKYLGTGLNIVWGIFESALGTTFVAGVSNSNDDFINDSIKNSIKVTYKIDYLVQLEFFNSNPTNTDYANINYEKLIAHKLNRLYSCWPAATIVQHQESLKQIADTILYSDINLPVYIQGTQFQLKVWQTLWRIPYGNTTGYSVIAKNIDSPKACRAVGTAIGNNPISLVIPCHRVIQSNGDLGGYAWGLEKKRIILNWESRLK
jgi:O-6-methylguanine DNA methyltransferase